MSVETIDLTPAASAASPETINVSASDFTDDADTALVVRFPAGATMPVSNLDNSITNTDTPAEFSGDLSVLNAAGPSDGDSLLIPANSNLDRVTSLGNVASIRLYTNSTTETSSTWEVHTDGSMAENLIRLLPDQSGASTPLMVGVLTTAAIKTALESSNANLTPAMTARGWSWIAS